ncbi:hypothetical protein BDR26DRAFT_853949 [Obelidium mucronatum]|nr:hypothetical protein BDR26DRAFT_853949 [Obelidium mucronatum]
MRINMSKTHPFEWRSTLDSDGILREGCTRIETERTKKDFLLEYPRGAYTATRTIEKTKVINGKAHISRLLDSWIGMDWSNDTRSTTSQNLSKAWNVEAMKQSVEYMLKSTISEYYSATQTLAKDGITDESTITILMLEPTSNETVDLLIHIEYQLAFIFLPCTVAFYGSPRINPRIKDSQWSRDRKPLELAAMKPGINELLLTDDNGNIYEGLTSNFFVLVKDETVVSGGSSLRVISAPQEFVLNGTILKNVQHACRDLNIPFLFEFPSVGSVRNWVGAFVTS